MTQLLMWQAAPSGGMNFAMMFPLLIFLVFFIFFIYLPQSRQRKQQQTFINSLHEGMEVVTQAGIVGKITKVEDKTVRLMIDEKTFMRVLKTTVTSEFKA